MESGGRHGRCDIGIETALIATGLASMGPTGILFSSPFVASLAAAAPAIGTLASIGSAASSLFGGMQGQREGEQQSEYALASAAMAGKESARQASEAALQEKQAYTDTMRRQKIAYLKSGVELEGSPLLVMEDTRRRGESNIDQILSSGASQYASSMMEGQLMSKKAKTMGRSEFTKGITGALSQLTTLAA